MESFEKMLTEDIRLVILRLLQEDPSYSHNDSVLCSGLGLIGHDVSHDRIRTEISWLKEQNLVTVQDVGSVWVVKLTERGSDAALGRTTVPGVKRPRPKD